MHKTRVGMLSVLIFLITPVYSHTQEQCSQDVAFLERSFTQEMLGACGYVGVCQPSDICNPKLKSTPASPANGFTINRANIFTCPKCSLPNAPDICIYKGAFIWYTVDCKLKQQTGDAAIISDPLTTVTTVTTQPSSTRIMPSSSSIALVPTNSHPISIPQASTPAAVPVIPVIPSASTTKPASLPSTESVLGALNLDEEISKKGTGVTSIEELKKEESKKEEVNLANDIAAKSLSDPSPTPIVQENLLSSLIPEKSSTDAAPQPTVQANAAGVIPLLSNDQDEGKIKTVPELKKASDSEKEKLPVPNVIPNETPSPSTTTTSIAPSNTAAAVLPTPSIIPNQIQNSTAVGPVIISETKANDTSYGQVLEKPSQIYNNLNELKQNMEPVAVIVQSQQASENIPAAAPKNTVVVSNFTAAPPKVQEMVMELVETSRGSIVSSEQLKTATITRVKNFIYVMLKEHEVPTGDANRKNKQNMLSDAAKANVTILLVLISMLGALVH